MKKQLHRLAATAAFVLATLGAQAAPVVVDVSGAQSINLLGEAGNTVWLIDIGAHSRLNGLDWNVTLEAFAPSLLSEMQVSFGSASGLDLLTLAPDIADGLSGAGRYAGSQDLAPLGVTVGADGLLRIEFSDEFKDFAVGTAEGHWLNGTLTFDVTAAAVPEPASAALVALGVGVVGWQLRRTRRGLPHTTRAPGK
ncbi:PEP-CTERM sorting domain-containing protein [Roseateles sp. DC23W]|uniref:PEP-CTERM sorting domain-containing protein n=1 Tax=Pelomonas dachongensis TaxID=3299029 RepID=A0ABW7EWG7_9BURK